jgi:CDGSH-type Zn-finger protein
MKRLILAGTLALLTGCANFTNKVYCDGAEAVFVSWYSSIGIAAKIDPENGARRCKAE